MLGKRQAAIRWEVIRMKSKHNRQTDAKASPQSPGRSERCRKRTQPEDPPLIVEGLKAHDCQFPWKRKPAKKRKPTMPKLVKEEKGTARSNIFKRETKEWDKENRALHGKE